MVKHYTLVYSSDENELADFVNGYDFSSEEYYFSEDEPSRKHHNYINNYNGIDVWYNIYADYFIFTEQVI